MKRIGQTDQGSSIEEQISSEFAELTFGHSSTQTKYLEGNNTEMPVDTDKNQPHESLFALIKKAGKEWPGNT